MKRLFQRRTPMLEEPSREEMMLGGVIAGVILLLSLTLALFALVGCSQVKYRQGEITRNSIGENTAFEYLADPNNPGTPLYCSLDRDQATSLANTLQFFATWVTVDAIRSIYNAATAADVTKTGIENETIQNADILTTKEAINASDNATAIALEGLAE